MRRATTMLIVGALLVALTAGISEAALVALVQCDGAGDLNPKLKKCLGNTAQTARITGNEYGETIDALAGDDVVDARGGNDKVSGGEGKDYIEGGTGNDTLRADEDHDIITDKSGPDTGDPPDKDVVYLGEGSGDSADVSDGDGKDVVDCTGSSSHTIASDPGDTLRNCNVFGP